jgi:hydroxymethylglutaryl-CoA reductase
MKSSRIAGFYKKSLPERVARVVEWANLDPDDEAVLTDAMDLDVTKADQMIENVVGIYALPLGIGLNFQVNGRDYLIPMVIEEPSVVAGASYAAKLLRAGGGIQTTSTDPVMIGQIQVLDLVDPAAAVAQVLAHRDRLMALADEQDPLLVKMGGGARDIRVRHLPWTPVGPMMVVELLSDCRDAMGANSINTACEALAPVIEEITGGRVNLRILSNLADQRTVSAEGRVPVDVLGTEELDGPEVAQRIVEAYAFAVADPYRAATHNKGIMNGIDAVVMATGNDWRAVEAGAHAYATRDGSYTSLSRWWRDENGDLCGRLDLPMAVGMVGGATRVHPGARLALKILGVSSARELAEVIAAVGLAQNLAAIRALATTGIQAGHMRLHARQLAAAAGATGGLVEKIAGWMVEEGIIRLDRAQELLVEQQAAGSSHEEIE